MKPFSKDQCSVAFNLNSDKEMRDFCIIEVNFTINLCLVLSQLFNDTIISYS